MNDIKMLFRSSDRDSLAELAVAKKYFDVVETRMFIPKDSLVVGRYSVLPYYRELERDLAFNNSRLINSAIEHKYIANFDWYHDIADITPRTWFDATAASFAFDDLPHGMVLKGRTNSAKSWYWMYAKTKADFRRIDTFLHQNEMLAHQGIVYREYIPLDIIEKSCIPNSFDFVNEWRCFFYKTKMLAMGYYWTMAEESSIEKANNQDLFGAINIATQAAHKLAKRTNFFVVDVAKTAEGNWIVIEVNDGQMSGLSCCNEELLYSNLKTELIAERRKSYSNLASGLTPQAIEAYELAKKQQKEQAKVD